MAANKPAPIRSNQITPQSAYLNRRAFMRAGVLAASTIATGWVYRQLNAPKRTVAGPVLAPIIPVDSSSTVTSAAGDDELAKAFRTDEKKTSFEDITHYNNFYEFSTDKGEVAQVSSKFISRPWMVSIKGLVA